MKRLLPFILTLVSTLQLVAQDTTWVQTYTFDTIVTRRANFVFPQELNDKRFEKVQKQKKESCSSLQNRFSVCLFPPRGCASISFFCTQKRPQKHTSHTI